MSIPSTRRYKASPVSGTPLAADVLARHAALSGIAMTMNLPAATKARVTSARNTRTGAESTPC